MWIPDSLAVVSEHLRLRLFEDHARSAAIVGRINALRYLARLQARAGLQLGAPEDLDAYDPLPVVAGPGASLLDPAADALDAGPDDFEYLHRAQSEASFDGFQLCAHAEVMEEADEPLFAGRSLDFVPYDF